MVLLPHETKRKPKGDIKMNPFVQFMASMPGRIVRIVVGAALLLWGFMGLEATTGIVVMVIGLIPLLAGLFDVCLIAPLFGAPLSGPRIRAGK
jgi:hypothetical protein